MSIRNTRWSLEKGSHGTQRRAVVGITVRSTCQMLDAALGPVHWFWGMRDPFAEREGFFRYVPKQLVAPVVLNFSGLARIPGMLGQWWKGNLATQDAYLQQMSRGLAGALQRLVGDLELCGFDYRRLYAKAPAAAANHVLLLGHSHQYVSAMARLAESRGDRLKMWRGARHASTDGKLTKEGQALLTSEHPMQDLESRGFADQRLRSDVPGFAFRIGTA